jgi:hypothetical protein
MTDHIKILRNLIETHSFHANETAFAIPAVWFRNLVEYFSENRNLSQNIQFPPCDTIGITSIYSLHQYKDFVVVNRTLYESIIKQFGGGPDIPIEVVEDPDTNIAVPIVRLESYKVILNETSIKVKISKYRRIADLRDLALETLQVCDSKRFEVRRFWSQEAGAVLPPDQMICWHSVLFVKSTDRALLENSNHLKSSN